MRPRIWSVVVIVAAIIGFTFAAFSTYDFVAHLDRQVHGLHCSFFPGIAESEASGGGCAVTLMSPYSSVLRDSVWGGIPISLPAMGVFAFIAAFAVFLIAKDRLNDERSAGFLVAATALPVLASAVMAYISFSTLDAACKLCIGIYVASALAFIGALGLWWTVRRDSTPETARSGWPALAVAFGIGVAFVVVPVAAYAGSTPDFERYVGACGELAQPDDPYGVLVPLGPQGHGVQMVEVFDPLCPSCRSFEERYEGVDAAKETKRRVLLFPLDDECNWMVDHAIHPGACAVSEAILCAEDDAEEVVSWAFTEQERIVAAATEGGSEAAKRMIVQRFPQYRDCVGSPTVRAKLNLGLRWAVDNQLPVLTPQIYVGGTRLCDEDTDIGLDFALTRLIERTPATTPPPPTERPIPSPAVASTAPTSAAVPAEPAEPTEAGAAEEPGIEPAEGADEAAAGSPTTPTGTAPAQPTGTPPAAPTAPAPTPAAPTPQPPAAQPPAPPPPAAQPPPAAAPPTAPPTTNTEVTP